MPGPLDDLLGQTGAAVGSGIGGLFTGGGETSGPTTTEEDLRAGQIVTEFASDPAVAAAGIPSGLFDAVVQMIQQGLSDEEILQALRSRQEAIIQEAEIEAAFNSAEVEPGTGSRAGFTTDGTDGQLSEEQIAAAVQALVDMGIPLKDAENAVADDPLGVLEFLIDAGAFGGTGTGGGGGGGGGSSRFLFPEEQEAMRLQNAILQRELEANPFLEVVQDPTTGNTLLLDTQTGESRVIGQFGFAEIDPERQFALDTAGVTGFFNGQPTLDRELGTATEDRLRAALESQRQFQQGQLNISAADQDRLRRALEAEVQSLNQQADVQRFDRLTDVLRNPSDFVARAFLQRGVESPTGQITQADLLNALRQEIRDVEDPNFQLGITDIFNRNQLSPLDFSLFSGGQTATQAPAPTTAPAPSPTTTPSPTAVQTPTGTFDAFGSDPTRNQQLFEDRLARGADPAKLAEFQRLAEQQAQAGVVFPAADGTTNNKSRFALVGERGPELLIRNNDGSFDVIPNELLADDVVNKSGQMGVSRFQFGTINQEQLQEMEQSLRPPGVDAVFGGQMPDDLRFNFPLTTPQQLASLTPDERTAFGTTLAVQANTTLQDLQHAMSRRFLGQREGRRGRLNPGTSSRFGFF